MNPHPPEHDALLSRLLVDYDAALAGETPATAVDASVLGGDANLAAEWAEARHLLELLDRFRPSVSDGPLDVAASDRRSEVADRAESGPAPAGMPASLGRFRIQGELGRGGLGIVYRAFDSRLGRQVALKVPRPELLADGDHRRRFLREAEAAARLNHPHAVAVHESGEVGPTCYIATEYCSGPTLAQWLKSRSEPVPVRLAARMVMQLACAAQHAHGRGVLHRDIKPSNVLLVSRDHGAEADGSIGVTAATLADPTTLSPRRGDAADVRTQREGRLATETEMADRVVPAPGGDESQQTLPFAVGTAVPHAEPSTSAQFHDRPGETATPHDPVGDIDLVWACADDELCPKLADFGMAKLLEREGDETHSGALIGTPAYMAPEQAEGRVQDIDARTDVYALGAVLYELLYGRRLHEGRTHLETLRRVLFDDPVVPRRFRSSVPRDLVAICLKCLSRRREARYVTAQQLADDLERFLTGHPTEARPLSPLEWVWKWARRRPAVAALTLVSGATFVALLLVSLIYSQRVTRLLRDSEQQREQLARTTALARQREAEARQHAYAADMHLALQDWNGGMHDNAVALLRRYVPAASERDQRDFAWWFLRNLTDEAPVFAEHAGGVTAVAVDPDGRLVATAGRDRAILLWSFPQRELLARLLENSMGEVNALAFSPDGATLAAATDERRIRRWRIPSSEELPSLLGSTGWNADVEFSPDGQLIASCGSDRMVRLWRADSGESAGVLNGHSDVVRSLAFTQENLFSASEDGVVRAWDLATLQPDARLEQGLLPSDGGSYIYRLEVVHEGAYLAGVRWDESVCVWSIQDPQFGELADSVQLGGLFRAVAGNDDNTLAIGLADGTIKFALAKSEGGTLFRTRRVHTARVNDVAFIPGSGKFLTASLDGKARLVDAPLCLYSAHAMWRPAYSLRWRGSLLTSACAFQSVYVYDLAENRLLFATSQGAAGDATCADSDPRLGITAVLTKDGELRVLRWADGEPAWSCLLPARSRFEIAPDGGTIAASMAADVVVYDLETGRLLARLPHPSDVKDVKYEPAGKRLVTLAIDRTLRVWEVASARVVEEQLLLEQTPTDIVYTRDGTALAVRSDRIKVYELPTWRLLGSVAVPDSLKQYDLLGSGEVVVTHSANKVQLFRVSDGAELLNLGEHYPLDVMAVSPDGNVLAVQKDVFLDFIRGPGELRLGMPH